MHASRFRRVLLLLPALVVIVGLPSTALAANGDILWSRAIHDAHAGDATGLAVQGDHLFVTRNYGIHNPPIAVEWAITLADHSYVRRYTTTGDPGWDTELVASGGRVASYVVGADATGVYVAGITDGTFPGQPAPHGSFDAFLARLDPATGSVAWVRQFNLATSVGAWTDVTSIRVTADGIYVSGMDPTIFVALYRRDGSRAWMYQTSLQRSYPDLAPLMDADDSGVVVAGLVAAGIRLIRFDSEGRLTSSYLVTRWPIVLAVALAPGGGEYVLAANDPVSGSDLARVDDTGVVAWSHALGCYPLSMSALGEEVFVLTACDFGHGVTVTAFRGGGARLWSNTSSAGVGEGIGILADPSGAYVFGFSDVESSYATFERIQIDTLPPVTVWRANRIPPFIVIPDGSLTVQPSWRGTDAVSGLDHYQLQSSPDGKSWSGIHLADPLATTILVDAKPGSILSFRVRAVDQFGNVGAWSKSPPVAGSLVQESAKGIAFGPGWKQMSVSGASGGGLMRSSTPGATASFTAFASSIGFVTEAGPNHGRVAVFLDGKKVQTVDLYAAQPVLRTIAFAQTFATAGKHTLKLVVKGTSGRPEVDVDAFEVLKPAG